MKKVWDKLGIAFSSACVVHCIMVAFLPLFIPALSQISHRPWVHLSVGFTILFTSPMAFIPGLKKHGLTWIISLAVTGLVLILSGMILERTIDSEQISHGISIIGSTLLVWAHYKNLQHTHRHNRHKHPHHHRQCC